VSGKCVCCGEDVDEDDRCRGCRRLVCVKCVFKHEHYMADAHWYPSKRPKKQKRPAIDAPRG
jgi:hypothetical protein